MPFPDEITVHQAGSEFIIVADKKTGRQVSEGIVRANQVEGWYEVEKRDDAGKIVRDDHGFAVIERHARAIKFKLGPDAPPFFQHEWGDIADPKPPPEQ